MSDNILDFTVPQDTNLNASNELSHELESNAEHDVQSTGNTSNKRSNVREQNFPEELLQLISQNLDSEIDLIHFRSVCHSWLSSIPKNPHNNHFPFKLPPFSDSNINTIRNLSKHSIFLIKPPTTPNQQQTLDRPWLVGINRNCIGKINLWQPLLLHQHSLPSHYDVLNFKHLPVLHLGHVFYILDRLLPNSWSDVYSEKVVVATSQGEQPLDVVTHNSCGESVVFRCGKDCWMKIPTVEKSNGDICIFKGRPCVVGKDGRTMMIGPDLSVHLVAEPFIGGNVKFLVESGCELLLVDRYISNGNDDVTMDVFRLDENEKKWIKLANLGDRVLFLGKGCSFSASASDLGFDDGNFVIYGNGNELGCEMSVFHLNLAQVSLLYDYPDYCKLFWPPPTWLNLQQRVGERKST